MPTINSIWFSDIVQKDTLNSASAVYQVTANYIEITATGAGYSIDRIESDVNISNLSAQGVLTGVAHYRIVNPAAQSFKINHNKAGSGGDVIYCQGGADITVNQYDTVNLTWCDGKFYASK